MNRAYLQATNKTNKHFRALFFLLLTLVVTILSPLIISKTTIYATSTTIIYDDEGDEAIIIPGGVKNLPQPDPWYNFFPTPDKIKAWANDFLHSINPATWVEYIFVHLYSFVLDTVLYIPLVLISNDVIQGIYSKFVLIAICLMVLLVMSNGIKIFVFGQGDSFSEVFTSCLKSVFLLLFVPRFMILLVQFTNKLTYLILKLGSGENSIVPDVLKSTGKDFINGLLAVVYMCIVTYFLVKIAFYICTRYWNIVKLFALAPLAIMSLATHSSSHYFQAWKNGFFKLLQTQIAYALYLLVFTSVISINFEDGTMQGVFIKTMLIIGGAWSMSNLPNSVSDVINTRQSANPLKYASKKLKQGSNLAGKLWNKVRHKE